MNQYKITLTLSKSQLIDLLDFGFGGDVNVEPMPESESAPTDDTPKPAPAPEKRRGAPRGPRGSKVNDAILGAFSGEQPQTTKALRMAVEAAGLAAGSLSTGLAILQRQGQIERVGDGLYALKLASAAE